MTATRAQMSLLGIFVGGLVISGTCCILVYVSRAVSSDDLSGLLTQLITVYSVHLAVIAGGIFGLRRSPIKPTEAPAPAFTTALALTILWNVLLIWRFAAFCYAGYNPASDDTVDKLSAYVEQISKISSFLIDGALAFFFAGKS